jgi:hypothetical protein
MPAATALTISQAGTATDAINIAPASGYVGTVQLACASLPQATSCSFEPSSVIFSGVNAPVNIALTIHTGTSLQAKFNLSSSPKPGDVPSIPATLLWIPGGLVAALSAKKRPSQRWCSLLMLTVLFAGLSVISACGGAPFTGTGTGTAAGTTTVQVLVTGTGNLTQAVNLNLTVQ